MFLRGIEHVILSPHLTDPKSISLMFETKYGTAQSAVICIGIMTPHGTC